MKEQNIMENDEVMRVAEDIVAPGSGVGLKLVGGAAILGGAIYGGIKLFKKIKAKKAEKDGIIEVTEDKVVDIKDVEDKKQTEKRKSN